MTRTPNHGQRDRLPDDKTHAAGISVLHRFWSALPIRPHVHSLIVDGVYVEKDGAVVLHDTPPPTLVDLEDMADRVGHRLRAILKRTLVPRRSRGTRAVGRRGTVHPRRPQPAHPRPGPADGHHRRRRRLRKTHGDLAVTIDGVNLHVCRASGVRPVGTVFFVRVRDTDRLYEFFADNVKKGSMTLFTPVTRDEGSLVVVHLATRAEFLLPGIVEEVRRARHFFALPWLAGGADLAAPRGPTGPGGRAERRGRPAAA